MISSGSSDSALSSWRENVRGAGEPRGLGMTNDKGRQGGGNPPGAAGAESGADSRREWSGTLIGARGVVSWLMPEGVLIRGAGEGEGGDGD
jgi:hypothetical protein